MPVYGTEAHLPACLASVLGQSFTDLEVIVVDDCSPGDVAGIVGQVAAGDSRVRLIRHDVNQGLIRARLTGAREARGRYLAFVDSDDEVEDFFLASMYPSAIEHDADVVQCELMHVEPDGTSIPWMRLGDPLVLHDGDIVRGFLDSKIWNMLCVKLIRTTVWTTAVASLNAEQESIYFGEDMLITFLLAANSSVFVAVPKCGYRYIQRPTSITTASDPERMVRCINDIDAVYRAIRTLLAERGEPPALVEAFFQREFARVVTVLLDGAAAAENSRPADVPRPTATLGLLGAIVQANADHRPWNQRPFCDDDYAAEIELLDEVPDVRVGGAVTIRVAATNLGGLLWTEQPDKIRLTYRWWKDGEAVVADGLRSELPSPVRPGERSVLQLQVMGPETSGEHVLVVDLVHEGIRWFGIDCPIDVDVRPASSAG
jgi:hypothetical protein